MMSHFMYDKAAVGARIREIRQTMQLTQEKLAEKTDISLRSITDIERSIVGLSLETLMALCTTLHVTPNDLLLPTQKDGDQELEWAISALTNADDHVRSSAIDILRSYLRSV